MNVPKFNKDEWEKENNNPEEAEIKLWDLGKNTEVSKKESKKHKKHKDKNKNKKNPFITLDNKKTSDINGKLTLNLFPESKKEEDYTVSRDTLEEVYRQMREDIPNLSADEVEGKYIAAGRTKEQAATCGLIAIRENTKAPEKYLFEYTTPNEETKTPASIWIDKTLVESLKTKKCTITMESDPEVLGETDKTK